MEQNPVKTQLQALHAAGKIPHWRSTEDIEQERADRRRRSMNHWYGIDDTWRVFDFASLMTRDEARELGLLLPPADPKAYGPKDQSYARSAINCWHIIDSPEREVQFLAYIAEFYPGDEPLAAAVKDLLAACPEYPKNR